MDKCNNNVFGLDNECNVLDNEYDYELDNGLIDKKEDHHCGSKTGVKTQLVRTICEGLGRLYKRVYKRDLLGFSYYERSTEGRYVCLLSRGLLFQVSTYDLEMYKQRYENHGRMRTKFLKVECCNVLVIYEKAPFFRPQVGFIQRCIDTLATPFVMLSNARELIAKVTSKASQLLLFDVLSLLLNLRDGYLTANKIMSVLLQLYTIHVRYMDLFSPTTFTRQSGPSITDILCGFSMMGLPPDVLNAIKTFTALTGKRIFDAEVVTELAEKVFSSIRVIIQWIASPFSNIRLMTVEVENMILAILDKLGSSVFMHRDIKQVCEVYTKYVSNPQILFDPSFRETIMNKYQELRSNSRFMAYVQNGNNKYFSNTWNLFETNVVKSCEAFDTSGRDEPICFVFEGEAGSGKSCLMNSFVALLKESGKTTICHSVPAAEDGKDFYDDYENQEVFVMDDVGQQGKSQWRYLINYVSPVKYPLPCATASKKNTKFFNSKIILCTTNHFRDLNGFTSSDCISEPEALYRRAHVINVARGQSEHFSQDLKYYKYDHINSKQWENRFVNHAAVNVPDNLNVVFSTADELRADNGKRVLAWLYSVFLHVVKSEKRNNAQMMITTEDYKEILGYDRFTDANDEWQAENGVFDFIKHAAMNMIPVAVVDNSTRVLDFVKFYSDIYAEFVCYYVSIVNEYVSEALQAIVEFMIKALGMFNQTCDVAVEALFTHKFTGMLILYLFCHYVVNCFFGSEEAHKLLTPEFNSDTVKELNKLKKHESFGPQSGALEAQHANWVKDIQRYCKTLVVRHDSDPLKDEHTQCVVSGKRILLPAHLDIGDKFIDVYSSWNHYKERHVELENVQLRLIRKFILSDLAVYEVKGTIPLYKINRQIFPDKATDGKNWYLINSTGSIPVMCDRDVMRNVERVQYNTVYGKCTHEVGSGFYTPYSTSGACGTVLAAPGLGIIGFHVAGSASLGFCVQPTEIVMREIREMMLVAPSATNFELDTKIIPNFSGVRVRYEDKIEQIRALGDTALRASPLHVEVCEPMQKLIASVEEISERYTTVPVLKVDVKAPPNFRANGTPAKTLKVLSRKTFMHQGRVTQSELLFVKECLRSLMVEFNDLEDSEVAFGGAFVPSLNKDSSNGYGCLKEKEMYFDFAEKLIKPEAYELIERVRRNAEVGTYDYNDFMCRETFKDELRKSTKICEPRTFRVMPLGHIWWTKKIFGQLLKHFKETRMKTGISVGYNPYVDADELAKKLKGCAITGDADFGKWDGTILAVLIRTIMEVLTEFYRGDHSYMIEWLSNTISNSFVLVNDEILATTHGLPSGTWLTLLLNCLLNKCLTALVIYRHKPQPCVEDFESVIDFVTGDDKVFGAQQDMAPYFNLMNIKEVSESLGMDCTNGDKTKITRVSQEFDKLTYVKRHFRVHPRLKRYVGCLAIDTILNTLQWVDTTTEDIHEAMLGKMRAMQIEAFLHSTTFFKELTKVCEDTYPFEAFFDEARVLRILLDPAGYDSVINMQHKNFSH